MAFLQRVCKKTGDCFSRHTGEPDNDQKAYNKQKNKGTLAACQG